MSSPLPTKSAVGPDGESDTKNATGTKPVGVREHRTLCHSSAAVRLDLSSAFDVIVATTRSSVYEVIVLHGHSGDVLVRGGSQFPEFCQVRFVGSTAGGSALKLLTIDIGLRMEFRVGASMVVTTSAVQSISVRSLARAPQARA